jgi:hypothetical protein
VLGVILMGSTIVTSEEVKTNDSAVYLPLSATQAKPSLETAGDTSSAPANTKVGLP